MDCMVLVAGLKDDNPNSGIVLPSLRPFSTLHSQDSRGRR